MLCHLKLKGRRSNGFVLSLTLLCLVRIKTYRSAKLQLLFRCTNARIKREKAAGKYLEFYHSVEERMWCFVLDVWAALSWHKAGQQRTGCRPARSTHRCRNIDTSEPVLVPPDRPARPISTPTSPRRALPADGKGQRHRIQSGKYPEQLRWRTDVAGWCGVFMDFWAAPVGVSCLATIARFATFDWMAC